MATKISDPWLHFNNLDKAGLHILECYSTFLPSSVTQKSRTIMFPRGKGNNKKIFGRVSQKIFIKNPRVVLEHYDGNNPLIDKSPPLGLCERTELWVITSSKENRWLP